MGVLTLADFRTEIQSSTGNRGIDNARLDRWINFGYLDLAGAIKFASLDDKIVIPTVASQANYAITGSPLLIRFVVDATSNLLLGWHTPVEYFRVKDAVTGTAAKWTREKDEIFIHPVPAGVVSLEVYVKEEPVLLIATGDVTVLPATWDNAIFLLSTHHALLALGEEQRAAAWFNRAITYIQSRISEDQLEANNLGTGMTLPGTAVPEASAGAGGGLGASLGGPGG